MSTSEIKQAVTLAATDALVQDSLGKKWYASKTFWLNVLAASAIIVQMKWGFVIDSEMQMLALSMINLILRKITKEPILF